MARISRNRRGRTPDQASTGRKLRNLVIVGGLLSLSSVGAVFVANSAVSAPAPGQNLTICHRTDSNTNPYVIESPNINATGLKGGHDDHTGPIWNPTLKAQHIKWGDIIPPFTYQPKSGPAVNFPGLNWTAEGQQILANGCNIPTTVTPALPTVTQSHCNSDHVATVPEVVLPTTPGITYSISPAPVAGMSSVVTATADAPAYWFVSPATLPWVFQSMTTETDTIHFDPAPTDCHTTVVPVSPTIVEASCNSDHNPTAPTLTLQTTPGITYTVDKSAPYTAGETVIVTATADSGAGDQFVTPAPDGWVFVDSHTETFTKTFDAAPDCQTTVVPVAPTLTQSVCAGDPATPTAPTLTLQTTAGITYTTDQSAPYSGGETVVVTATVNDNAFEFVTPPPTGWVFKNADTETYTFTFDAVPGCTAPAGGVNPVNPTHTNSVCAGDPTQATAATLTLATVPAGVTYTASKSAPYTGGESVTVTAVADSTHAFSAPAPTGWKFVNAHKETFVVTFTATPTCSGALANTGVKTQQLIEVGGIALLFGLGLQFLGMGMRRRNEI